MNSIVVILSIIGMASAGNLYGAPIATYAAGPAVVAPIAPAVYSAPTVVKTHAYAAAPAVYTAPIAPAVYSAPIVKAAPVAYTAPVYAPAIAKVHAAPAVYTAPYAAPYGATIL